MPDREVGGDGGSIKRAAAGRSPAATAGVKTMVEVLPYRPIAGPHKGHKITPTGKTSKRKVDTQIKCCCGEKWWVGSRSFESAIRHGVIEAASEVGIGWSVKAVDLPTRTEAVGVELPIIPPVLSGGEEEP